MVRNGRLTPARRLRRAAGWASPEPNYYAAPTGSEGLTAAMYPCPLPTPPLVGQTYITYEPLSPHEFLYVHHQCYKTRNGNCQVTRTSVTYGHHLSLHPSLMNSEPGLHTPAQCLQVLKTKDKINMKARSIFCIVVLIAASLATAIPSRCGQGFCISGPGMSGSAWNTTNYYEPAWGMPLAVVVPPTARWQSNYSWGVGGSRS